MGQGAEGEVPRRTLRALVTPSGRPAPPVSGEALARDKTTPGAAQADALALGRRRPSCHSGRVKALPCRAAPLRLHEIRSEAASPARPFEPRDETPMRIPSLLPFFVYSFVNYFHYRKRHLR